MNATSRIGCAYTPSPTLHAASALEQRNGVPVSECIFVRCLHAQLDMHMYNNSMYMFMCMYMLAVNCGLSDRNARTHFIQHQLVILHGPFRSAEARLFRDRSRRPTSRADLAASKKG